MRLHFLLFLIPVINTFITVKIHRDSLYNPQSTCAFIGNRSFSNDSSIQTCIWECVHEYNCQTAVYYKNEKICSIFSEVCHTNRIQASANRRSSVICYRKNHNPISTCPLSTTLDQEETTTLHMTTTATLILLTGTNETVYGVWNTTAGGNSNPATGGYGVGNYIPTEIPKNAFDSNISTKYLSFGAENASINSADSGVNTGFYLTANQDPSLLRAVQFYTANDHENRDPLTMTIEGSNATSPVLNLGSSWTLIYNGTTGLDNTIQRNTSGTKIWLWNNLIWYTSYRLLITSKRGYSNSVQYSEVEFFI